MTVHISAWRAQLSLTAYHPHRRALGWAIVSTVAIALLFIAASFFFGPTALLGAAFAALVVACLYWSAILATLMSTSGGALPHLVPHMLRAQLSLASLLMLLLSSLVGLVVSMTGGPAAALLAVLLLGIWSCTFLQSKVAYLLLLIVPSGYQPLWNAVPEAFRQFMSGEWGVVLTVLVAVLMAGVILPAGLRRRQLQYGVDITQARNHVDTLVQAARHDRIVCWIHDLLALRAVRRRDPAGLALMPLGAAGHWGSMLTVSIILLAGALVLLFGVDWNNGDDHTGVGIVIRIACASTVFVVAAQIQAVLNAIHGRRGEQALSRLAPRLRQDVGFNRTIALPLLTRIGYGWLSIVGPSLAFGAVAGVDGATLLHAFSLASMPLLLLPTVLRDYSRLDETRDFLVNIPLVIAIGSCMLLMAAFPATASTLSVLAVAATAWLCRQRLHRIRRLPPVFPAGGISERGRHA
jgi:hypothetical protein